jgi:transcriptional regulator with XRE-family HTH domain
MESYNGRLAANIKRERERHGEDPADTARRIDVSPRTYERWESGERKPQLANLAALVEAWGIEIEDLRPDLKKEAETLERIETKLDRLLTSAGLPADFAALREELETVLEQAGQPAGSTEQNSAEQEPSSGSQ